jgi:hypothetical protein
MSADTLLIEIGTEELPPTSLRTLGEGLHSDAARCASTNSASQHGASRWYATPRRLAVSIDALATTQPDSMVEKLGPRYQPPSTPMASQGLPRSVLRVAVVSRSMHCCAFPASGRAPCASPAHCGSRRRPRCCRAARECARRICRSQSACAGVRGARNSCVPCTGSSCCTAAPWCRAKCWASRPGARRAGIACTAAARITLAVPPITRALCAIRAASSPTTRAARRSSPRRYAPGPPTLGGMPSSMKHCSTSEQPGRVAARAGGPLRGTLPRGTGRSADLLDEAAPEILSPRGRDGRFAAVFHHGRRTSTAANRRRWSTATSA